jgi:hypothetical protein
MPVKKIIRAPDGRKLTVNAPDDASDDDVLEFAKGKMKAEDQAKERQKLVTMIEAQNKEIDTLRDDVLGMAKLVLKLTDRIDKVALRETPAPIINVKPEIKVAPANVEKSAPPVVQVMPDPAAASALVEIRSLIEKFKMPEMPASHQPGKLSFDIEHDMDRHSPRYGRIKRVTAS